MRNLCAIKAPWSLEAETKQTKRNQTDRENTDQNKENSQREILLAYASRGLLSLATNQQDSVVSKKIVFVTRVLHVVGGIERVTCVIASMLAQRGYEVTLISLVEKGPPYFPLHPQVQVTYLRRLPGRGAVNKLRNFYKQLSPDLIVVVASHLSWPNLPAAKGFRVVTWEHLNVQVQAHPLHSLSRKWAANKSTIVTLTHADAKDYRKKYRARDVEVIPNPITIDNLYPSKRDQKVVLAVGRLAGQKGFDRLLSAWSLIAWQFPDWKLRIVGSGRKEKDLRKQIAQQGITQSVELIPFTKNMPEVYAGASLFVLSSRFEGFGLVLLEAMAAHLPIVSFDCPHGPAEMMVDQETGLLIPNGDILAFAEAMKRLMSGSEERDRMGTAGAERVKSYLPDTIIAQWVTLIEQLTAEHTLPRISQSLPRS